MGRGGAVKIKERMWEGIVDAIPFEKVILKYVHTYILKEFKWCYLTDHHRLTNKVQFQEWVTSFWNCWPTTSDRPPNITGYYKCSGLPSKTWWEDSIAEDTKCFNHRRWRNEAGTHLEASFLLVNFHSAGRYCVHYWMWEGNHQLYSAVNPDSYNNDWASQTCPLVQPQHKCHTKLPIIPSNFLFLQRDPWTYIISQF